MAPAERAPASAARVVYAGILASTLIVTLGALAVSLSLHTATAAVAAPDALALLAGGAALAAGFRQRQRLGARRSGQSVDQWWGEHAGHALLLWGLLELAAMAGAVVVFATGHLTGFAVLAILTLSGLITLSPGRIASA